MAVGAKRLIPRCMGARILFQALCFCFSASALRFVSTRLGTIAAPEYDLNGETKLQGSLDLEPVKLVAFAARKDLVGLISRAGEAKVAVQRVPNRSGMSWGLPSVKVTQTRSPAPTEPAGIGCDLSKRTGEESGHFLFRDSQGNPVWHLRSGKYAPWTTKSDETL